MPTNESSVSIILKGSADWVGWNREFQARMDALDLFAYVNGDRELLEEPPVTLIAMKVFRDLRADRIKRAQDGKKFDYLADSENHEPHSSDSDDSNDTQVTIPTSTIANTATTAAETTVTATQRANKIKAAVKEVEEHFKTFATHILAEITRNHEAKRKEWMVQRANLLKAQTYMQESVATGLRNAHFSPGEGIRQWYDNLKGIAFEPREVKGAVRVKLRAHLKTLEAPKYRSINQTDFERWMTTWEAIMDEATLYQLPEATVAGLWFDDLVEAIGNPLPTFAAMYRVQVENPDDLTFRKASRDIRRGAAKLLEKGNSRINKGSFPAFGGTPIADRPKQPRGTKRKGEDDKPKCGACEGIHTTPRCYYLFPETAPEGWEPRDHVRERFEENLKKNPELRKEATRLRPKKSKSNLTRGSGNKKGKDETDHQSD
jgi:hypothetical protein